VTEPTDAVDELPERESDVAPLETVPTEPVELLPEIDSTLDVDTLPTEVVDEFPEIETKTTGVCVPTDPVDAFPVTDVVTGPPPDKELNGTSENAEIPNINYTAVSCRVPLS
jgi:hypothetical protein